MCKQKIHSASQVLLMFRKGSLLFFCIQQGNDGLGKTLRRGLDLLEQPQAFSLGSAKGESLLDIP